MTILSAGIINRVVGDTIDSFEDGNTNEYTFDDTDGSEYNIVDESSVSFSAIDGSKMLEVGLSSSGGTVTYMYSNPGDGLDNYFAKGQEITVYVRQVDNLNRSDIRIAFGMTDSGDYYAADIQWDAFFALRVLKRENSSTVDLANNSAYDLKIDQWYEVVITWDDGTLGGSDNDITISIREGVGGNEVLSSTVNDSTFANVSGIGFLGDRQNEVIYVDYEHLSIA